MCVCCASFQVQSRKQELSQLREQLMDEEIEQLRPANVSCVFFVLCLCVCLFSLSSYTLVYVLSLIVMLAENCPEIAF